MKEGVLGILGMSLQLSPAEENCRVKCGEVSVKEGVEKTVAWFKEEVKHQKREFL